MPYIVGLTGGIGSGKSTIATLFAQHNVPIIDADQVARQVVGAGSPLLQQIVAHFGRAILLPNGELNRKALREKIFHAEAEKAWLNALLHPAIRQEMHRQLHAQHAPYVLWVVPLLIENQLTDECDRILVVDVSPDVQLERATQRDHSSEETIRNIMAAQVDRHTRLQFADDVIENNLPLAENLAQLNTQVAQLHQQYTQFAQQKGK